MSWDDAKQAMKSTGSGNFIRLKDGEEITGVFVGEPSTYYKKFKDNTKYSTYAEGRSLKFSIIFAVKEGSEFVSYTLEQGVTVLRELIAMKEEYGMDLYYKIKRTGSTKDDTVYHILPKDKLTDAEKKAIQAITTFAPPVTDDYDDVPPPTDEDMPVDSDTIPF